MPFLNKQGGGFPTGIEPTPPPDNPAFFTETIPDAFSLENTIGSAVHNGINIQTKKEVNPNFDPFELMPAGHEQFAEAYAYADSKEEVDKITAQVDDELKMRETISNAGALGGVAMLAAGVLDPVNLIPIGGVAYKTYKLGHSILTGALATSGASALSMTAQEAALHGTQITRTVGESAMNIGAATLLGGVLGGTVGAISKLSKGVSGRDYKSILNDVENDLNLDYVPPSISGVGANKAMSEGLTEEIDKIWARTDISDAEKQLMVTDRVNKAEGLKGNKATDALLLAMGRQDPLIRTVTSESTSTRIAAQKLSEIPSTLDKNSLGAATESSVESQIKGWRAGLYRSTEDMNDLYVQMIKGRSRRFGDVAVIGVKGLVSKPKMTYKEFRIEVGKALRRGDAHDIPEVSKAAKSFRKNLYDPLKNDAISLKLLPKDVKVETAISYLNRRYNLEKLAEPKLRARFIKEKVIPWMTKERGLARERIANGGKDARDKAFAALDDSDIEDNAATLVQHIEGGPSGRMPYDVSIPLKSKSNKPGLAGELKTRSFTIDDIEIEEFLENDISLLASAHMRSLAPDIEIVRNFGDIEMTSAIREIEAEWEGLSKKGIKGWIKKRNRDILDMKAMRDRLRGTFSLPRDPRAIAPRVGRVLRQLNYVRLLGGMTLSAIPDTARIMMVHGFANTYLDLIKPLMTNFKSIRLSARDIKDMGGAVELQMNSRINAIADVSEDFMRGTKFERGLGAVSDTFGIPSLMAPWNQAFKEMAGIVSMQRIFRAVQKDAAGKLKGKELEFLRSTGIDTGKSQRILDQFSKHGGEENGVMLANWLKWENVEASKAFQQATIRDIDRIIVTPGQDIPLTSSGGHGEIGRMILQFKTFAISSMQRTMLAGLQQNDAAFWGGATLSIFMGMAVYALKETAAGRTLSNDPTKWVQEGVDRSGSTGYFPDINNSLEKLTGNAVGISAITGTAPASRYISRNAVGALLGPTFGTLSAITTEVRRGANIANGKDSWEDRDTQALRRLMPYNNLFYARRVIDKAIGVNK